MTQRTTRRQFIAQAGVAAQRLLGCTATGPRQVDQREAERGLRCHRGRAGTHTGAAKLGLHCICFTDVDRSRWNGVLSKKGWEKAAGYTDWRKMFEKHAKDLDVVFVATPDHSHFAPR